MIDEILIKGEFQTRASELIKIAGIKKGTAYSESLIEPAAKKLQNYLINQGFLYAPSRLALSWRSS